MPGKLILPQGKTAKIRLEKCDFYGNFIKSMVFAGYLKLNEKLDFKLKSTTNVSSIVVPLEIAGPLNDPKPNYEKLVLDFSQKNIRNILDPRNLKKLGVGVENTIQNTGKLLDVFKDSVKTDQERGGSGPSRAGGQIKDGSGKQTQPEKKR